MHDDTIVAAGIAMSVPRGSWPLLAVELAGPPTPVSAVVTDARSRRLVELAVQAGLCELLRGPDDHSTWDREPTGDRERIDAGPAV